MIFAVIGEITDREVIAVGGGIHDLERLRKTYGSGRWRKLKGTAMKTQEAHPQFVVCIQNAGYPTSLELRKIYQVLPDEKAATHNLVRVIDESGEDYLYPQRFFVPIELPHAAKEAFAQGAS